MGELICNDSSDWGHLAVLGAKSLIRLGRFDIDDWRDVQHSAESIIKPNYQSSSTEWMNSVFSKAIISTLPLILFYHENPIKLRQNLQQIVDVWQVNSRGAISESLLLESALAVGYAIAQSLTERLKPDTLIPQTIAFLGETQSPMAQQLAQVQTLLDQGAGLERAVTQLQHRFAQPTTPIALAFYCFLGTLEDLQLSVRRAARIEYQPQITSAITGALSGAYNSTSGIPISWRNLSRKPLAAWGMTSVAQMLELSDSLVAVWSGVYDHSADSVELTPVAAIAAPRVIRSQ